MLGHHTLTTANKSKAAWNAEATPAAHWTVSHSATTTQYKHQWQLCSHSTVRMWWGQQHDDSISNTPSPWQSSQNCCWHDPCKDGCTHNLHLQYLHMPLSTISTTERNVTDNKLYYSLLKVIDGNTKVNSIHLLFHILCSSELSLSKAVQNDNTDLVKNYKSIQDMRQQL